MHRIGVLALLGVTALGHQHAKTSMFVEYMADGALMQGYMTYKPTMCTATSRCPAVVIIQDWNGLNEYEQERACMVADIGYVAFAADIYGVDTPVATRQDWANAAGSHISNATKYMGKIHGALSQVMTYDFVDASKMAAMGYCFGGTGLINIAMTGYQGSSGITFPTGLLGLVSYHGGLSSGYEAPVAGDRPKLMVHSGSQDDTNADIETLTDHLESVNATYEISRYGSSVVHAFTEWDASSPPRNVYSAFADQRSWEATMHFFHELFSTGVDPVGEPNLEMNHSDYMHADVSYNADGAEMLGWMIYNSSHCTSTSKCPVVVVVQDWDGVNEYEQARSYLLAQEGYVAFAADIYGVGVPKESIQDWIAASSAHSSNATKYMNKIHGAILQAMSYDFVDASRMVAMGYCFGGTGMINVAMSGYDGFPNVEFPTGLKGVVSFHAGLSSGYAPPRGSSRPRVLIHSGAEDGSNSNKQISKLTDDLEGLGASYEINRFGSGVAHAFTRWDLIGAAASEAAAYDSRADSRSWHDTLTFLHELFAAEGMTRTGTRPDSSSFMCDLDPATVAASTAAPEPAPHTARVVSSGVGLGTDQSLTSSVMVMASLAPCLLAWA